MLGSRYAYDAVPILELSGLQIATKHRIEGKIRDGIYRFESAPCIVCDGRDFDLIASKDRYGLWISLVICRACGLLQLNPRMCKSAYDAYYPEEYHGLRGEDETPAEAFLAWQYQRGERIHGYLEQHGLFRKPAAETFVLEIGCGAGGVLRYFRDKGYVVRGIDVGEPDISFGKTHYGLDLVQGAVADIVLERHPDIIICAHVLEHLVAVKEDLAYIHRLLHDEGILYVEVPGVRKSRQEPWMLDFLCNLHNAHTYYFTLTSLTNLMESCGFFKLAGDEEVRSVFRRCGKEKTAEGFIRDYEATMAYLVDLENRWLSLREKSPSDFLAQCLKSGRLPFVFVRRFASRIRSEIRKRVFA